MAAGRLWLTVAFGVGGWLAGLAAVQAADERASPPASDFRILAIKPEHKAYNLIPIGETKIDTAAYRAVVDSLPRGLFGLYKIRHNMRAEAQQCAAACSATKDCDTYTYVRPDRERRVGVCHLQRRVVDIAAMKPVIELADTEVKLRRTEPASEREPAAKIDVSDHVEAPAADNDKAAVVQPSQETQLAQVETPWVGAEHSVIYVHPTLKAVPPVPAKPQSENSLATLELDQQPLLAVAGICALALAAGGLGAARKGQRQRTLARLSTKIVTNGLDQQSVSFEGGEVPELSLRFALRRSAAVGARDTDVTIVPEGAPA